jgi:hypothetical protein
VNEIGIMTLVNSRAGCAVVLSVVFRTVRRTVLGGTIDLTDGFLTPLPDGMSFRISFVEPVQHAINNIQVKMNTMVILIGWKKKIENSLVANFDVFFGFRTSFGEMDWFPEFFSAFGVDVLKPLLDFANVVLVDDTSIPARCEDDGCGCCFFRSL